MEKICAYAVLEVTELFDVSFPLAYALSQDALKEDASFRLKVVSPKDKKTLMYQTINASDRFFMESRANDLKEVNKDEKP